MPKLNSIWIGEEEKDPVSSSMNAWVRVLIVVQITINTSAPSPHDSRHGKFVAGATDQGIEEEFNAFMEQVDDKDNILNLEHR